MIVHIVIFQFKDKEKEQNILKAKEMLERLVSMIDVLKTMEVGININDSERAYDMSLYSTFDTKEDLAIYANHPEHIKVLSFIKDVVEITKVVDYEK